MAGLHLEPCPPSCVPTFSRSYARRLEGVQVSRGFVVFRLNRFLEFAYSFLVLLLIHQHPTKVEVCLAITGLVFNGTSVFCRGFRNKASPLEEVPEIVVSVGVIGVDINGLPKCILCRLKLFCS